MARTSRAQAARAVKSKAEPTVFATNTTAQED